MRNFNAYSEIFEIFDRNTPSYKLNTIFENDCVNNNASVQDSYAFLYTFARNIKINFTVKSRFNK